jgi:hypothetical protein
MRRHTIPGQSGVGHLLRPAVLCAAIALSVPVAAMAARRSVQHTPPLPRIASALGRPPTNCPPVNPKLVHVRYNNKPNVVPHTIWWVQGGALAGYSGWELQSHRLTLAFGGRTKYGYPQKIFWQRTPGAPAQVALYGWNLRTKQRIWFGEPLSNNGFQKVIAWPSGLVRDHFVHNASAPTFTFVPAAGCYVIRARWNGGAWTLPFAAGALP